jgi:tRNA pseudouridine55 synthase
MALMAKPKRGATDLSGILAVDKPAGLTSHDVVDRIRRLTGEGRVGHAGTLDPMATGLLLLCIGSACKQSETLMAGSKVYQARVVFGAATATDDAQGSVITEAAVPAVVSDEDFALQLLRRFEGQQQQLPPQVSAIKKDGVAAYRRVRRGEEVVVEPRTVTIYSLRLLALGDAVGAAIGRSDQHKACGSEDAAPWWDIEAEVSKGTYIRSLARDIGEAVGSCAHLGALRRTRIGEWTLADAHKLEDLEKLDDLNDLLR